MTIPHGSSISKSLARQLPRLQGLQQQLDIRSAELCSAEVRSPCNHLVRCKKLVLRVLKMRKWTAGGSPQRRTTGQGAKDTARYRK